jgi:hypothetical protein
MITRLYPSFVLAGSRLVMTINNRPRTRSQVRPTRPPGRGLRAVSPGQAPAPSQAADFELSKFWQIRVFTGY